MSGQDRAWLAAAARISARARVRSRPNPAVGALIVGGDGAVIARGWTQPGGRPHAEAVALDAAGGVARGASVYVTLEPCAHESGRGPSCADLLVAAAPARVVIGVRDPDPRTSGMGIARLREAGITVIEADCSTCRDAMSGYLVRAAHGRPSVTLKLAVSADGKIARADGTSKWITGEPARAHAHLERARHDAILVGGGTLRADNPRLDVRLPGLAERSPERWVLTRGEQPPGWRKLASPEDLSPLAPAQYLMVEGGAHVAADFMTAGHVDRLLVYRAPAEIGADGLDAIAGRDLAAIVAPGGGWQLTDRRMLGSDTMEDYSRAPCSPE